MIGVVAAHPEVPLLGTCNLLLDSVHGRDATAVGPILENLVTGMCLERDSLWTSFLFFLFLFWVYSYCGIIKTSTKNYN